MKKRQSEAFGKNVYLLGLGQDGETYWLEAPRWDCNWYWGFGYIETYTNKKNPSQAKDISSHQHADGKFETKNDYDSNIFTGSYLTDKTFSEKEGWELRELMTTFYNLRTSAEVFGRGGSHIASPLDTLIRKDWAKEINEVMLPIVFKRIIDILS